MCRRAFADSTQPVVDGGDGHWRGYDHKGASTLSAALPLTACGEAAPEDTPQDEIVGGNAEPDEAVSEDVTVADVELAHPSDDVYEVGEDAELYAAITNTGTEAVTLTAVEGPDFTGAVSSGAGGGDLGITVDENDNVYIGAEASRPSR